MIYADNAATTRISDIALEKMLPFLQEQYGNASSQYSLGAKAKRAIGHAREQVALAIGAKTDEIMFTSGGSEANNWLLQSIVESFSGESIHIITSSIEHKSILKACHTLEGKGTEFSYLPVNSSGQVSIEDVKISIRPNTKLVSIMFANNEIGSIQPIAEIGSYLHKKDILFHTDAVQAVGHIPVDVNELNLDFLSASAHKFNGAKGTGFLYKRSSLKLPPMILGGEQERGYRAGTENVAEMETVAIRLKGMVVHTVQEVKKIIPSIMLNGYSEKCLPGMINFGFDGILGESLMNILDLKGVCVSTSSACNASKDIPSHVLLALGLSVREAKSAIRISYGKYNTFKEIDYVVSAINDAYAKIKSTHKNLDTEKLTSSDCTQYFTH